MREIFPVILSRISLAALALCLFSFSGCSQPTPEELAAREDARLQRELDALHARAAAEPVEAMLAALSELNGKYPNRPAILEELAFAYTQAKKPVEAGFFFEESARLDPKRASLLLCAAEVYTEQSDWESVARALQNYAVGNPNDAVVLKKLAQTYAKLNRTKSAVETYLDAVKLQNDIPPARECLEIGQLFQALGNRPQAEQWYLRALQGDDENNAHCASRLGLLEIAIVGKDWAACETQITALDTHHPGALDKSRLASIREDLKRYRAAHESLGGITFKTPSAEEMLSAMESREIELLPPSATSAPENAPAQPPAAQAQNTATDHAASPAAIPAQPPAPQAAPAQADVPAPQAPSVEAPPAEAPNENLENVGAPQLGTPNNGAPVAPAPTNAAATSQAQALVARAETALAENRTQEAFDLYWRALPLDENNAALWDRTSAVAAALGKYTEAKIFAMEARRRAPDSLPYAAHYLDIVKIADAPERYVAELALVRSQFPDEPSLTYRMARAVEAERPLSARGLYQRILDTAPQSPEAALARAALEALETQP